MEEQTTSTAGKPRVLFLSSCVAGGGVGRSLATYLQHDGDRIDAHVVLPEPGIIAPHLEPHARLHFIPEFVERPLRPPYRLIVPIPVLNLLGGIYALWVAAFKISRLAKRIDADLIYCNHMLAKPVGTVVGLVTGIPVIFHARNIHDRRFSERVFYQMLARVPVVKRIICNSHATSRTYVDAAPQKTRVVPNFVDLAHFDPKIVTPCLRRELNLPQNALIVGYVGRLVRWKGVDVLIRAFADVAEAIASTHLVILGGNDSGRRLDLMSEYKNMAQSLGIADRVHFLGFRDDIRPYLADFDINVLPSVAPEPFGRVLIEGMALGVPAIVTAHGGAPEVIREEIEGRWAVPGVPEDLATQILDLLQNDDARREMSAHAAANVQKRFDGRTIAARLTNYVYEVAQRQPHEASVAAGSTT